MHTILIKSLLFTTLVLISGCTTTEPLIESKSSFNEATYHRAEKLLSWNLNGLILHEVQNAQWDSNNRFWYRIQTEWGKEFILVDVARQIKSRAFDHGVLAKALSDVSDDVISEKNLPFNSIVIENDVVRFTYNRKQWEYSISTQVLREISKSVPAHASISPDNNLAVYIKESNLWVRDLVSETDVPLTQDGTPYFGYATNSQGWTRSEVPILAWSDDSRFISTYRLDEQGVEKMNLLEMSVGRPILHSWPYAIPGDTIVPLHYRYIFDLKENKNIKLDTPPEHQRTSNCCGLARGSQWADNAFSEDGNYLFFVSTSRDYATVSLKIAETSSGTVRTVYQETDEPFFESNLNSRGVPNWRVMPVANEFIWYTRKDNWGHLYLHDLEDGSLKNRITSGSWNVIDIHFIDQENRKLWFTASGREPERDPYQEYLYSINFDGTDLKLLTPETGNHTIHFAPGGMLFADTWSDFSTPPVTVIRDRNGEQVMVLETADITRLTGSGWTPPEPFVAKARDGETDIYGILFKPSDFDASKKYPIINNIYPGPQVGSIRTRSFSAAHSGQARALAELGFIVVQIDALGTPKRSKEFHTAYYGDMADNGLPDQIGAMKQLADRFVWIDIQKAGIYGHSGGGYATAAAMLNYPDFFKVGVSSAGNHDNRGYTYYWGEKFQGPRIVKDKTDTYSNQANQLKASQLKGKLLLSYGTMDTNVHPNMTLNVVNELIRADKDFDLMVYPNRGHGYFNEKYNIRITWNYFIEHLHGVRPSETYRIK